MLDETIFQNFPGVTQCFIVSDLKTLVRFTFSWMLNLI